MSYRFFLRATLGAVASLTASGALAQEVSAEANLQTDYLDDNGSSYSGHRAVAQASVEVAFGGCGVHFWGSKTLSKTQGDEFDTEVRCAKMINDQTEVSASVAHYAFAGPDMLVTRVGVTHKTNIGTIDVSVSEYTTRGPDATRFQLGFSPKLENEAFDLRIYGTHEQGYGLKSITTAGLEAKWHLNDQWSLTGNVVVPLHNLPTGDQRGLVGMVGIRHTF